MMRFVRDFGRLLIAMLLVNMLLIWVLALTGTWSRWAARIALERDLMRGGAVGESLRAHSPIERSNASLLTIAQADPELSFAARLIARAAEREPLPPAVTIFLPTDAAFERLPPNSAEAVLDNPDAARDLLHLHTTARVLSADALIELTTVDRLSGHRLPVEAAAVRVGGAAVVSADIAFSGGLVHKIDRLLLPNNAVTIDTPDGATQIDYAGEFITINGAGQPNTLIVVYDNRSNFGTALVNAAGRWSLSGSISPGQHEIVAYMVQPNDALPLGVSRSIVLNVEP